MSGFAAVSLWEKGIYLRKGKSDMLFNETISNPMLSGAIEAMRLESSSKNKEVVLEEILKATFLCPATVSTTPLTGEDGRPYLPDDCEIQQQMVQDAKGRPLLLAFTDQEQMERWKSRRAVRNIVYGFGMSFTEYTDLMLQKLPDGTYGPAQGIVIDPYGCNLVLDRDMVANILVRRMARQDEAQRMMERVREQSRIRNVVPGKSKETEPQEQQNAETEQQNTATDQQNATAETERQNAEGGAATSEQ